jgi:hypothetical protein
MPVSRAGAVAVLLLGLAQPVFAQKAEGIDVSRLPLNFERLERNLRISTSTEERDGLNIRYLIQIYGQAPPIIVWRKEDNLVYGPVPYGAPTHREIIEHITPREYRSPPADISALIRWLQERAKK